MQMPSSLLQILKTLDVKHVVAPDVLSEYDIQQWPLEVSERLKEKPKSRNCVATIVFSKKKVAPRALLGICVAKRGV